MNSLPTLLRIALREMLVEIGHRRAHRGIQAAGIDIAQGIGREIAEQAHGPMHILQKTI